MSAPRIIFLYQQAPHKNCIHTFSLLWSSNAPNSTSKQKQERENQFALRTTSSIFPFLFFLAPHTTFSHRKFCFKVKARGEKKTLLFRSFIKKLGQFFTKQLVEKREVSFSPFHYCRVCVCTLLHSCFFIISIF